ncbi:hypothetical protein PanWU01x14_207550, partial [Parasponia andersonii]
NKRPRVSKRPQKSPSAKPAIADPPNSHSLAPILIALSLSLSLFLSLSGTLYFSHLSLSLSLSLVSLILLCSSLIINCEFHLKKEAKSLEMVFDLEEIRLVL